LEICSCLSRSTGSKKGGDCKITEDEKAEGLNKENSLNLPKEGEAAMSSVEKEQKIITRRDLLKGAAVGAVAVAGAGVLASCKAAPAPGVPEKWDKEADVVVVGYGGAGAAAAIEAAEAGAEVLILEKAPVAGGATAICGGIIYGAGTSVQKAAGIQDTAEEMYKFWMACGGDSVDPDLVRLTSEKSAPNIEWLISLGCDFPVEKLYMSGAEGIEPYASITPPKRRGHWHAGQGFTGPVLFKVLADTVKAKGAEVLLETSGKQLIADPDKEILGLKAETGGETLYIRANRAVILASGGYARNKEMLKAYSFKEGYRGVTSTTPYVTGDGILMAQALGADLKGMNEMCSLPAVKIDWGNLDNTITRSGPIILVNERGKRFCDETVHYDVVCDAITRQHIAFAVFSAELVAQGGKQIAAIFSDDLAKEIGDGIVIEAASIVELATKLGVEPASLEETIDNWNTYAEQEKDPEFGRAGGFGSIKTAPFYATEVTIGIVDNTGGLEVNTSFQVIDIFGKIIPRLYAAGPGMVGGIMGPIYPGSGSAVCAAICSGRITGKNAAAEEPWS